jgi:toxin-antitoxin system PIN domain toxin
MRFLLDVNVLLALSLPTHQHHRGAGAWLATGPAWATTPITESGYLRLMTNPRVVGYPIPVDQVLAALRDMRGLTGHEFFDDGTSLAEPIIDLRQLAGSRQVTDYHLVNLAARHGAALATFDASLRRSLAEPDRERVHVIPD